MTSAYRRVLQWATFNRLWWVFDAKWQDPFDAAPVIARYLLGKHKPIYHPIGDTGDHVVVVNSRHIAMEGELWRTFTYSFHTGYPMGLRTTRAYQLHEDNPTKIVHLEVKRAMKSDLLRRPALARLHVFANDCLPDNIRSNISDQIPQITQPPRPLSHYTPDEIAAIPKLFDWPVDYVKQSHTGPAENQPQQPASRKHR